jgi:hypothetical protein
LQVQDAVEDIIPSDNTMLAIFGPGVFDQHPPAAKIILLIDPGAVSAGDDVSE